MATKREKAPGPDRSGPKRSTNGKAPRVESRREIMERFHASQARSFEFALARVQHGITADARKVLAYCAKCMDAGAALPPPFASMMAQRFREIAELSDPWNAKLLKRRRGQKSADLFDWKCNIARRVWLAHTDGGMTVAKAAAMVAGTISRDRVTPEQAAKWYAELKPVFAGDERNSTAAAVERAGHVALRKHPTR